MAEPSLSAGMPAPFGQVLIMGADNLALVALRDGAIQAGDITLLWTIKQFLCWRSGRCKASTADLARAMASTRGEVSLALGRLVAAGLVIKGTDGRRNFHFLALHPLLCTTGGPHRRRLQWLAFYRHAADPAAVAAQAAAAGAGAAVTTA